MTEVERVRVRLRTRPLVIVLAVVALMLCWVAAIHLREASSLPGSRFDAAWAVRIDAHHTHTRDVIARMIALVGGAPVGILVDLSVAALMLLVRGRAACFTFLTALSLNEVSVLALKWVSERHSPGGGSLYLGFLGSFPSGHTANAAVIVVSVGLIADNLLVWSGAAAYVAVMALDRTYLDAHWVTDTVAGAVAGAAVTALVWYVADPSEKVRNQPERPPDEGFSVSGDAPQDRRIVPRPSATPGQVPPRQKRLWRHPR